MSGPVLFTIPSGYRFADALARGLTEEAGASADALADMLILVPTRRAVRAVADAFLRLNQGRPLLLPRLAPIGDVDEDALLLDEIGLGGAEDADLPPAIPDLRRRLMLTRLVMGLPNAAAEKLSADQAARLAGDLAHLLDQVQTEGLDFAKLDDLVPELYAGHWQRVLEFLRILTDHWPRILAAEACLDPAARRDRLIDARVARWRARPPAYPVIAAGSTGSVPATARLLACVAGLPAGRVVLPGLDTDLDDDAWDTVPATHPQYGMKRLLERIEATRADVRPWPVPGAPDAPPTRRRLVAAAMRPADAERPAAAVDRETAALALRDVRRIDCATADEEAGVVALLLRETLEVPGRTAALVTPDRLLARRVAADLARWSIDIDDSGGRPLAHTAPGAFLLLTAEMATAELAPVPLLAALKHPLAAGGLAPGAFRQMVRALEVAALRGPRPAPGFGGLRRALSGRAHKPLRDWLDVVKAASEPLLRLSRRRRVPLSELLAAHVACAEALAAADDEGGPARLWAGDAGEAAARFVAELEAAAGIFPPLAGTDYPGLLQALMAGRAVRPRFGRHPRLFIWGPLEARLQGVDRVVLGGLNEGTWPAPPAPDPWMSRPMRRAFGLPPAERQIGLAAHDFAQALGAAEVFLTRAERVEGAPTVESRWLLRLDAAVQACGLAPQDYRSSAYRDWHRALDAAPYAPEARPAPRPPVEVRPRVLSVTAIETWLHDPYAIYARYILGLRALDPIDADPGAAEQGNVIHHALDRFIDRHGGDWPADPRGALLAIGEEVFAELLDRPGVATFWWPRFARIADWFVRTEEGRRSTLAGSWTERRGRLVLDGATAPFTLTAKADRIDRLADGRLVIVDYKTGILPTDKKMKAGLAPQLPLEALIAAAGGFEEVPAGAPAQLAFWHLTGGREPGRVKDFPMDPAAAADEAAAGLCALIARFDNPATPYLSEPRSAARPRFSDYRHLARVQEWDSVEGDGE